MFNFRNIFLFGLIMASQHLFGIVNFRILNMYVFLSLTKCVLQLLRVIQQHIKKPLAELVLFGELAAGGGTVNITVRKDQLVLKVSKD